MTGIWSSAGAGSRALRLDRTQLDRLLRERGLLQLLDDLLERVLAAARAKGLDREQIDAVLPVGGTSRLPSIRHWLAERCGSIPLRDQRPVEAVALGALALTPGVRLKDVLARGVSLRCWDQRGGEHRWHPLFLAGQSWPTDQPLEMVLSCSRDGQSSLELVLGEPIEEERSEVVFIDGLPQVRRRPAGEARTEPWSCQPPPVILDPPGSCGIDRLRLRFSIDAEGQLLLESEDLLVGTLRRRPGCLVRCADGSAAAGDMLPVQWQWTTRRLPPVRVSWAPPFIEQRNRIQICPLGHPPPQASALLAGSHPRPGGCRGWRCLVVGIPVAAPAGAGRERGALR